MTRFVFICILSLTAFCIADENTPSSQEATVQKNNLAFQEKLKNADFDYQEKIYGQALNTYQELLKEASPLELTKDKITEIKIKIAHCHFELNQYYAAMKLLDPILKIDHIPLEFDKNNFLAPTISLQNLYAVFRKSPSKSNKLITEIFPQLTETENTTENILINNLNNILNTPEKRDLISAQYLNPTKIKNPIILQMTSPFSEYEQKLRARLILEDIFPLNSYLNNALALSKKEKESFLKDSNYYEALYWRSRINLETYYYANARLGFNEVALALNYKETEKVISILFYKAKALFLLKEYKLSIKELENLQALYSLNDFYKDNFTNEVYYLLGRSYLEISKFDKAIQKFLTITAGYENREPSNLLIRQTYYWLGETYYCKEAFNDAIKSYKVVLEYGNYAEREKALYSLGWAYFKKGDLASQDLANEKFKKLLQDYPETPYKIKAQLKLAEIEIEKDNPETGEKIIQEIKASAEGAKYLEQNDTFVKQIDYLIGMTYTKKKDYNRALTYLKRGEDTSDILLKQKILYYCGVCYKELNEHKKAISSFMQAIEATTPNTITVMAKSDLADTYLQRKSNAQDLEDALKVLQELIIQNTNNPSSVQWQMKIANIFRLQNKDEQAISTLNKISGDYPEQWELAQLEIGNILMTANPQFFQVAANHYQKIKDKLKNTQRKEEATLNYGIALMKANQAVSAIAVLENLITVATAENIITDAYQYLAKCFENQKNITKALEILEDSLRKYPKQNNLLQLHKECVRLYQTNKNYDKANQHQQIILDLSQTADAKAEALYFLAGLELQKNQKNSSDKAIENLNDIVKLYPKSPLVNKVYFLLLQTYLASENLDDSRKMLELLSKTSSETELFQKGAVMIGDHYYQKNDYLNAIEFYKKVTFEATKLSEKATEDSQETILNKRANCLFQLKRFEDAIIDFMSLIRLNKNNSLYKIRYAQCSLEINMQLEDAVNILENMTIAEQNTDVEKILEQLKAKIKQKKEK